MKNLTFALVAVTCVVILVAVCSIGLCTFGLLFPPPSQ